MPAAAVIPAPLAYIKVAAVKKLVVGFRAGSVGPGLPRALARPAFLRGSAVRGRVPRGYFE